MRVIDTGGEQLGIMDPRRALELAQERDLDLVEIAPTAKPPVCRILDFGKYKYELSRKEREARKKQHVLVMKGIRLTPLIDDHDFEAKARLVKKLLGEGDKVRIFVIFRGREIVHPEIGWRLLQRMLETLKEVASADNQPSMLGRQMRVILSPITAKKTKQEES